MKKLQRWLTPSSVWKKQKQWLSALCNLCTFHSSPCFCSNWRSCNLLPPQILQNGPPLRLPIVLPAAFLSGQPPLHFPLCLPDCPAASSSLLFAPDASQQLRGARGHMTKKYLSRHKLSVDMVGEINSYEELIICICLSRNVEKSVCVAVCIYLIWIRTLLTMTDIEQMYFIFLILLKIFRTILQYFFNMETIKPGLNGVKRMLLKMPKL